MNKVCLTGRFTDDLKLYKTNDGKDVGAGIVAVRESKDKTSFIDVVIFGELAKTVQQHAPKGTLVGIEGYLRQNTYTNADGEKRSVTGVVCESIDFLSKKPEDKKEQPKEKAKKVKKA